MEYLLTWGYLGLFFASFLAATILPFSSEVLITGMLVIGASPLYVFIVATTGNWLGSLLTYGIGWLGKWKWIEKWFKISHEKMEKQQLKIKKYGSWLAFFVWLPVIGDIFALALGFYRVSFVRCLVFILVGKALRYFLYILLWNYVGSDFVNICLF